MERAAERVAAFHLQQLARMPVVAVVDWVLPAVPVVSEKPWVEMAVPIPQFARRAVAVARIQLESSQHAQKPGVNALCSVVAGNLAAVVDVLLVEPVACLWMVSVRRVQPEVQEEASLCY